MQALAKSKKSITFVKLRILWIPFEVGMWLLITLTSFLPHRGKGSQRACTAQNRQYFSRIGTVSMADAALSPTISSVSGFQTSFDPALIEIKPNWHMEIVRWAVSSGSSVGLP